MSRAERDLLDRHAALARERLRAALASSAETARTALDPSALIRAHPEMSLVSSFAVAWIAGRGLRSRKPAAAAAAAGTVAATAAAATTASTAGARAAARKSPLRAIRVVLRFARVSARQWILGRVVDYWTEDTKVGSRRRPRVA